MRCIIRPVRAAFLLLLLCSGFFSCKKNSPGTTADLCTQLAAVKAHATTPVSKGESIRLTADSVSGANYYWSGPGNYQSYYQNNDLTTYADYSDRGWYYLRVSVDGCNDDRFDSVYVDVSFPQGSPSCTQANNTASFSGAVILGNQSFYGVSFANVLGDYEITANSSNGDMNVKFSAYWLTHDLENGIYYTTSMPSIDYGDIDKVFISDVNNSIYWVADPDKAVYVSHAGNKQQITFCSIPFSGSFGGNLYHTTVNAKITQP